MKNIKINLRIPGPTPLPPQVLKAISHQMINHRGAAYEEIQKRVTENLQYFFQTKNDIFLLTASGMGGLEAAIVNFFSPGDTLIFLQLVNLATGGRKLPGDTGQMSSKSNFRPGRQFPMM